MYYMCIWPRLVQLECLFFSHLHVYAFCWYLILKQISCIIYVECLTVVRYQSLSDVVLHVSRFHMSKCLPNRCRFSYSLYVLSKVRTPLHQNMCWIKRRRWFVRIFEICAYASPLCIIVYTHIQHICFDMYVCVDRQRICTL